MPFQRRMLLNWLLTEYKSTEKMKDNVLNELAQKYAKPEIIDLDELESFLNELIKGTGTGKVNVDFLDADNWDFISDFKIDYKSKLLYLYWHKYEEDPIFREMRQYVFPYDTYALVIRFKCLQFVKDENNVCFLLIIHGESVKTKQVKSYLQNDGYSILDTNTKASLFSVEVLRKCDGKNEYLRFLNTPISSFGIVPKNTRILPQETQTLLYLSDLEDIFSRIDQSRSILNGLDKSQGLANYENDLYKEGNALRRTVEALYKLIICFYYEEIGKCGSISDDYQEKRLGDLGKLVKIIYSEKSIEDNMTSIVKVLNTLSHDSGVVVEKKDVLSVANIIKDIAKRFCTDVKRGKFKEIAVDKKDRSLLEMYIKENWRKWNFLDLIPDFREDTDRPNNIEFRIKKSAIILYASDMLKKIYLCNDGFLHDDAKLENIFVLHDRKLAIELCEKLFEEVQCKCEKLNFDAHDISMFCLFDIELNRIGKPIHLFTREEIRDLIIHADDKQDNQLVVDENGFAQMISYPERGHYYPVSIETFCAGNGYVGREPEFDDLEGCYGLMLTLWYNYLEKGRTFHDDCYEYLEPDEEQILIKKIKAYY